MGCWTSGSAAKTSILNPGGNVALAQASSGLRPAKSTTSAGGGAPSAAGEIYREQSDGEEDVGAFHRLDDGFKAGEFSQ